MYFILLHYFLLHVRIHFQCEFTISITMKRGPLLLYGVIEFK